MAFTGFADLHGGLGLALLVVAAVVLLTAPRWTDIADAVVAAFRPPARGISITPSEARWSSTMHGNRMALNLVVRVEVENRSPEPWHLATASLKGHRALALSIHQLAPPPPSRAGTAPVLPGAKASIAVHCILETLPPADPAAPFRARLVLVDQHIRENALRLAARGPRAEGVSGR